MRVSPLSNHSASPTEESIDNIRLSALTSPTHTEATLPQERETVLEGSLPSVESPDSGGIQNQNSVKDNMAVASDDSPFVQFLGTDRRNDTDDEEQSAPRGPVELDNLATNADDGDSGVPYLIQRTLQSTDNLNIASLHKYARDGDNQLLEQIISRFRRNPGFLKRKINALDAERLSPLHYAARYNHLDCVKVLVELGGADVGVLDDERATPLHHAARYRRKKSNKAIMEKIEAKARQKPSVTEDSGDAPQPTIMPEPLKERARSHSAGFESEDPVSDLPPMYHPKPHHTVRFSTMSHAITSISNGRLRNAALISRLLAEEEKPTVNNSVIMYLVEKGACVNQQDFYGCTALHYAGMRGNEVAAQQLLLCKDENTIEIDDNEIMTPLHLACSHNQVEIVRMLLETGANIRAREESGYTPLHLAAAEGSEEIVTMLFNQAEKLHKWQEVQEMLADVDNEMNTPLHVAVENGAFEVAQICIEKGADVNKHNSAYELPIHLAANFGSEPLVRLLIENNARIDALDMLQQTALHKAASRNHTDVVDLLLKNDADLERGDADSYTPLLMAAVQGHASVIKLLLSRDADIFASEMHEKTAIYLASEENYPDALLALLEAIRDNAAAKTLVDSPDKYNNTPLHVASRKGYHKCVSLLLEAGAQIDAKNEEEETPLHLAASNGRTSIVKMLIRYSSRSLVNDEDEDSNTPLHSAASKGHPKVIQLLLDEGADIDARNASKWSPLDCAASKGNVKAARVLLENDSPVDPTDKSKVTPLYLACKEGHQQMVELLLLWHADVTLRTVAENEDDPTNGSNCLDACIDNGHKNCAIAIVKSPKWELALRNDTIGPRGLRDTPMRKMIRKMPDVAEEVFSRCCTSNYCHPEHVKYKVVFNYEFLDDMYSNWSDKPTEDPLSGRSGEASDKGSNPGGGQTIVSQSAVYDENNRLLPTAVAYTTNSAIMKKNHPLMIMVNSKREDLLAHPLVTNLLRLKWHSFGRWFYYINLLIYIIFLAFFTIYMVTTSPPYMYINIKNANCGVTIDNLKKVDFCSTIANCASAQQTAAMISKFVVMVLAALAIVKELGQLWVGKLNYFDLENVMEWCIYILSFITVLDIWECQKATGIRQNWQWETGAIAIFLAWLNLVLFLRKVPRFGIYVVMLTDVLLTFTRFFLVFFLFMLAFAFGFYALLQNHVPFSNVQQSIIKSAIMMIGEFDFDDLFNSHYTAPNDFSKQIFYDGVTYTLFIGFLIIMSIIIMNLLVGLAVDDIKAVQEQAALKRMAMQVDMALSVESMLPAMIRRKFVIRCENVRPNQIMNRIQRFISASGTGSGTKLHEQLNPELDEWEKIEEKQDRMESQLTTMKGRIKTIRGQNERMENMLKAIMDKLGVNFEDEDEHDDEIDNVAFGQMFEEQS